MQIVWNLDERLEAQESALLPWIEAGVLILQVSRIASGGLRHPSEASTEYGRSVLAPPYEGWLL
jgi:hypothetical protein